MNMTTKSKKTQVKKTACAVKKLRRPIENRSLAGVALAFANYFDIDVIIPRLIFVITGFFGGGGVLAYIICWVVIPEEN